jgi:hypothetical protein
MGAILYGGYIVTMKNGHYVHKAQVDEQTLLKIARALDIPESDHGMLSTEFTSIVIYRGAKPP